MSLYLYGLSDQAPQALGTGLGGEALESFSFGGLTAFCGRMEAPPPVDAETLRAHDAVVSRLVERTDALLPARFGALVAGALELEQRLAPPALLAAIENVRGCRQMTLRIFGEARMREPVLAGASDGSGEGTRYLLEKRRQASAAPEFDPIRAALAPLVKAERCERSEQAPLIGTLYHLVPRGHIDDYRRATGDDRWMPLRVRAGGPWAPYAFVPELL